MCSQLKNETVVGMCRCDSPSLRQQLHSNPFPSSHFNTAHVSPGDNSRLIRSARNGSSTGRQSPLHRPLPFSWLVPACFHAGKGPSPAILSVRTSHTGICSWSARYSSSTSKHQRCSRVLENSTAAERRVKSCRATHRSGVMRSQEEQGG